MNGARNTDRGIQWTEESLRDDDRSFPVNSEGNDHEHEDESQLEQSDADDD